MTLDATLQEIEQLCSEPHYDSFENVNRPVYDRIMDVYQQLRDSSGPVSMDLLESFSLIVLRFFDMLDRRALGGTVNYSFHHDIGTLLRTSLLQTAPVHNWQETWKETRRRQNNTLKSYLEEPELFLARISTEKDRSEAVAMMQFAATGLAGVEDTEDLPLWFIPPYQVQLGKHKADGSFGAVYEGEWLDTDVLQTCGSR
ncbi:uncharacterized protein PITG_13935 [Phytophthora infestans T30-4]|uniref:Uncharacterized protein n=1 Tax=Phytophthora infestans (strain T30-4) TaxID=403677 RepID=D0NN51_PHYIT|nr:uncharacterized protein PITG_13935 [Phytophthora infestans T30-4]EEY61958.1 conserved hypothetical protein [Phytophthora infestans T30-4]|eukprot:XP_002899598.1 conserved hypothetical protein [Phytophthora infestans T30-4]